MSSTFNKKQGKNNVSGVPKTTLTLRGSLGLTELSR